MTTVESVLSTERYVEHKLGFERHILEYSESFQDGKVSDFPSKQGNLAIQSNAFWWKHSVTGFYQVYYNTLNKAVVTKLVVLAYLDNSLIVAELKKESQTMLHG